MSGSHRSHRAASASSPKASIPNAAAVFARANEIASEMYPNGCPSATILANIVRQAARELGLIQPKPHSRAPVIGGRTNKLSEFPEKMRDEIIRICGETTAANGGGNPCVKFGHACYRCQDLAANVVSQSESTGA